MAETKTLASILPTSKIPKNLFTNGKVMPVGILCSSQDDYLKFLKEKVLIMFNEDGDFTLDGLDNKFSLKKGVVNNYGEQYAFLLAKDKRFEASVELFNLIFENHNLNKKEIKFSFKEIPNGKKRISLFGNKIGEFGILGIYYYAKSLIKLAIANDDPKEVISALDYIYLILSNTDELSEIENQMDVVSILESCCKLILQYESLPDLKEMAKLKLEELKKYRLV